ncbi:MAG TPA: AbrB/MazE/SpoVT family DNA-binding domain-containing protein [Rhizomicrobium sp.]|jgi:AbrB family looped-hinge helix DNA binding protein
MNTTVTSKGQVTIPKRARDAMGIKPGSKVDVEVRPGVGVVIKLAGKPPKTDMRRRIEKVRGTLKLGMSTDDYIKLLRGD